MFQPSHFYTILLSILLSNSAIADCSQSTRVNGQALINALSGNTVCTAGAQEEHHGNGELWDYKTGDINHPVDPRRQIGNWSINANSVAYTYDDGTNTSGPFTFSLHHNGGSSYSFCGPSIVEATIVGGFGGC